MMASISWPSLLLLKKEDEKYDNRMPSYLAASALNKSPTDK